MDDKIKIVTAKSPTEFTINVQNVLNLGGWRVAQTEMSVTDSHYWAILIRRAPATSAEANGEKE